MRSWNLKTSPMTARPPMLSQSRTVRSDGTKKKKMPPLKSKNAFQNDMVASHSKYCHESSLRLLEVSFCSKLSSTLAIEKYWQRPRLANLNNSVHYFWPMHCIFNPSLCKYKKCTEYSLF